MQIYPEKYDKLDLSTSERSFLRTAERAFSGDELAYYVLHINPRKRDAGQGKAELFNMLLVPEGIVLLRFFDADIPLVATTTIKALGNHVVYSVLESDIRSKLEESNYLVRESGNLRFALNISFVFPNIDFSQVESELSETEKVFCGKQVLFKNDIHFLRKKGKNVLLGRLSPADEIKEEIVNNLIEGLTAFFNVNLFKYENNYLWRERKKRNDGKCKKNSWYWKFLVFVDKESKKLGMDKKIYKLEDIKKAIGYNMKDCKKAFLDKATNFIDYNKKEKTVVIDFEKAKYDIQFNEIDT